MSDREFWRLTPYEFRLLQDAYEEREEQADYRAYELIALTASIHRDPKKRKKPYKAEDFMPKRPGRKRERAKPKQSWQTHLAFAKALTIAYGGVIPEHLRGKKAVEPGKERKLLTDGKKGK